MAGKCRFKFYSLSAFFLLGAGSVSAEDKVPESKVAAHLQYRANLLNDDHGLEKTTGVKPKSTQTIDSTMNLIVMGEMGPASFVAAEFLSFTGLNSLAAYGTFKLNDMFTITAGQNYAKWGGYMYDQWTYENSNAMVATYLWMAPLGNLSLVPMLEAAVTLPGAGVVTLQLVNDVTNVAAADVTAQMSLDNPYDAARYNKTAKVTPILAYQGTFGPVTPLLQYFRYDAGHSTFLALGVKAQVRELTAFVDYMTDSRAINTSFISPKAGTNKKSIASLKVMYTTPKAIAQFSYSTTTSKAASGRNGNAGMYSSAVGAVANDHNENVMVVGVDGNFANILFRPFVEIGMKSGKFLKAPLNPLSTETETRSQTMVTAGIRGTI